MGGCTITRLATSLPQLFAKIEEQILTAAGSGLYPDSELIVIEPNKDKALIFEVTLKYDERVIPSLPDRVEFKEVEKGRAFHIGVAAHFGPKPEGEQLVGTIHVHT